MTEATAGLVWVRCPVCNDDQALPLFEKQGFSVVECQTCELRYVNPRPTPERIAAFYRVEYFASGGRDRSGTQHLKHPEIKQANAQLRLKLLREYCSNGLLVDVGCGAGFFVQAAERMGWSSIGLEPSPDVARRGGREQRVRIVAGSLEEAPLVARRFEVITMLDVLEHVFCPRAFLEQARRLLGSRGFVLIETPNMAGCVPRLMGPRHPWVRPPEHLTYFTPPTLRSLLEQTGFRLQHLQRRARKALTLDYVLSLASSTNPLLSTLARGALGWWRGLCRYQFTVPMDVLIVVAEVQRPGGAAE